MTNQLPPIDAKWLKAIDDQLDAEWREHCKAKGYSALAIVAGVLLGLACVFAVTYPIIKVLQ